MLFKFLRLPVEKVLGSIDRTGFGYSNNKLDFDNDLYDRLIDIKKRKPEKYKQLLLSKKD